MKFKSEKVKDMTDKKLKDNIKYNRFLALTSATIMLISIAGFYLAQTAIDVQMGFVALWIACVALIGVDTMEYVFEVRLREKFAEVVKA
jgi:hypothetical protein